MDKKTQKKYLTLLDKLQKSARKDGFTAPEYCELVMNELLRISSFGSKNLQETIFRFSAVHSNVVSAYIDDNLDDFECDCCCGDDDEDFEEECE